MKLKEKFKMTLPKLVSIMKKSENYGGILTMFAVVLVVAFWAIDVFGEDQPILAILALIAFLVYVVVYIVIFTVPNVYTVYKYRKEPWPQKHKFLWVLVGLGYAQVAPAWFVLPFRNNDMVARITVVIPIIVLIVANSAVKKVEKEKTRTKEQGKGLEGDRTKRIEFFKPLIVNIKIYIILTKVIKSIINNILITSITNNK